MRHRFERRSATWSASTEGAPERRDPDQEEAVADFDQSHWELPVPPPPDAEGQFTSTDLLNWWFQGAGPGKDWDDYFERSEAGEAPAPRRGHGGAPREARRGRAAGERDVRHAPPGATARDARASLGHLLPEPEVQLADEHAQAAVDCLYGFIHAFGRREVEAAMEHVSEEYHAMEGDTEIDRLGFRQHLEAIIDRLRSVELVVSLAEAPEPLLHEVGVLIDAWIQIDSYGADGARACWLEHRVAVLHEERDGRWRMRALGKVDVEPRHGRDA